MSAPTPPARADIVSAKLDLITSTGSRIEYEINLLGPGSFMLLPMIGSAPGPGMITLVRGPRSSSTFRETRRAVQTKMEGTK